MDKHLRKTTFKKRLFALLPALLLCLTAAISPRSIGKAAYTEPSENLRTVGAHETVEHLFTHCLISHPEIAFRQGNEYGKHLDRDCLTPKEFERILDALYENGYALVDARETFQSVNGETMRKNFSFPKDKKPLIMSFDDVVYAEKNHGKGMSDKLVLTKDGKITACTQTDSGEKLHRQEFLPIMEDFIEKHPDFSPFGARGIIFLTGFNGILGYRTQKGSPNRDKEIERVTPLLEKIRSDGWIFGCHSYAHGHMKNVAAAQMERDVEKWKEEVGTLVGHTQIYAYPYGEWILGENCDDDRQKALLNAGFSLFCGVGEQAFFVKMPLGNSPKKVLFQDRCPMDGVTLRRNRLERFFDCEKIYDTVRPITFHETK